MMLIILLIVGFFLVIVPGVYLYKRYVNTESIEVDAVVGESKWNKSKHEKSHYDAELSYTVDGKEFRVWLPLNKYDGSPYDVGTIVKIICNKKYPQKIYNLSGKISRSGKI